MSVDSMIGGGIRLVRTQPQVVAIWAALYLALMAVGMVVMRPWSESMIAFQQQAAAHAATGVATPPAFPAAFFGQLILMELVILLLLVVAFAAVVRATVRPGGDRFAYLRFGMDEVRLLGLGFLFIVAFFAAELVSVLGLVLIGGLLGLVAGKALGIGVAVVLALALFCGAIYAEVRLSLAGALTVMGGRIVVGAAWRATRGHFWTLFGAYFLLSIGFGAVGMLVLALTDPHLIAAYASFDQRALTAAAQDQLARQGAGLSFVTLLRLAVGAIVYVVMGAVALGSVATAAVELDVPAAAARAFE